MKNQMLPKQLSVLTVGAMLLSCGVRADNPAAGLEKTPEGLITRAAGAKPNQAQVRQMAKNRYGMFIHFGINTFCDQELTDGTQPLAKYVPKEIAAEEWVLAAKNAGMSHVVIVCKHVEGFCLWPTKFTDYCVTNTANKTDVIGEVAKACQKHGIRFAVYYSLWDRIWDLRNAELYKKDRVATNKAYVDYMVNQLEELMTQYGPVAELWLDAGWVKKRNEWEIERAYDVVKRHQPECQVAINWSIGLPGDPDKHAVYPVDQKDGYPIRYFPGDFRLGDPYLPVFPDPKVFSHDGKSYYMPFETTVCMNDNWFWHSGDKGLKSVDELEKLYYHATAQDNLLLLNSPPGPDGHMRPATVTRLVELRERLGLKIGGPFPKNLSVGAKASASSVWSKKKGYEAANAVDEDPASRWASETLTPTIEQEFSAPTRVNRIVLLEYGEGGKYRIGKFVIEALAANGSDWTTVAEGNGVGVSKKIDFPAVTTTKIRLRVLDASMVPSLYSFWAFETP